MIGTTRKYQQFLDEIGWEEFESLKRSYFFEELHPEPGEPGVVLHILPSEKKDHIIIKDTETEKFLEIPKNKWQEFRTWVEAKYAYGEDGAIYYSMKAALEKEGMMEEKYADEKIAVRTPETLEGTGNTSNAPKGTNVINIDGLANAVYLWLNYQTAVSTSTKLLHEASFRYPIAEFIERKMKSSANLEEDPKIFFNRPTDFRWQIKEKRFFLECKFVKDNYTNKKHEFQRYIDDICRLYYCIEDKEKDTSYFLVCGHKKDVESCLLQDKEPIKQNINKKRYNYFLNFTNGDYETITLDLSKADEDNHNEDDLENCLNLAYKSFVERYKDDIPEKIREHYKLKDKITITITCKFAPIISKNQGTGVEYPTVENDEYVYIWHVQKGKIEEVINATLIVD